MIEITTDEITEAGTYGPATGKQTIQGDLTISSPGVTLRNVKITGKLILGEEIGEGDVHLEGVTVEGATIVNGGGANSVYFTDTVLATVIVNKNTGAVRIVAQGSTSVFEVQLETPTRVVEQNLDENFSGFEDIVIPEAMQTANEIEVELEGEFETINSRATNVRINLSQATDIRTLVLNAAAQVLGTGTIQTAQINANGSTLSQRPQNVVLDIDGSVTIGDEEITESYSDNDTTSTELKAITAVQGSVNLDLENFIAGLTIDDFTISATVNGQEYALENVQYHPNQRRITFDPISLTDFLGDDVNITVTPNSEKVTGDSRSAQFIVEPGFAGRITDIQGVGIPDLTIKFREGIGTQEGEVVAEAKTDKFGYYSVNLPVGTYTGEFSAPGYVTTYMVGIAATDEFLTDQNETAIRAAASNEVKVMLSWGEDPWDLDSHLTGPGADGTPFHIAYYNKKEVQDGITYVDLDWDDTESFGPETTTIRKLVDGEYRFYIHHYSGDSTLRLSGAKVDVFIGNSTSPDQTFNVPTGDGEEIYWVVFDMKVSNEGETIEIEPVNVMFEEENPKFFINNVESFGYEQVTAGTTVELRTESDLTIYYSTDEIEASASLDSEIYNGPIEITENTTIYAIAVRDGVIVGEASGYFSIDPLDDYPGHEMPELESVALLVENLESLVDDQNEETVELADPYTINEAVALYNDAMESLNVLINSEEEVLVLDLQERLQVIKAALDEAIESLEESNLESTEIEEEGTSNEEGLVN